MLRLEAIGNLGADAECRNNNGSLYVVFRLAHSEKIANAQGVQERTTWVNCSMQGDGGKLLQFLRKGVKVFVRGNVDLRIYKSAKDGAMKCGINLYVREIELCGGLRDNKENAPC